MARCIADNESGDLLNLPIPLEKLDAKPSAARKYLSDLEQLHRMVVLYLWLAHRFPNIFTTRGLANYTKQLVEDAIEKTLKDFSYTDSARDKFRQKREKAMKELKKENYEPAEPEPVEGLDGEEDVPSAMLDVLKDKDVFASEPKRDDVDEYPTPELDAEEAENDSEAQVDTKEPKQ